MNQLNKYDIEMLKSEIVVIDDVKMTGFQVYERLQSPMIDEANYNYFVNCASTNAVIERIFIAIGV